MNTRGFTLIETVFAMAVAALLALILYPRLSSAFARSGVTSARSTVANTLGQARAMAMQTGQATYVVINGGQVELLSQAGGGVDTVAVESLDEVYKVTVTASTDTIRFDPRGLKVGVASATVRFQRDSYTDSVTISGYGKVVTP